MKTLVKILVLMMMTNVMAQETGELLLPPFFQPDPQFIKKQERPGPGSVEVIQTIHRKSVEIQFDGYKVTDLGYSQITPKVISLELAKHTVMDHRNIGEEGPCLAGEVNFNQLPEEIGVSFPLDEVVSIELRNKFLIDFNNGICQVSLQELVEVEIDGKKFRHLLSKDMGYRFIDDCTISQ